MIAEKKVNTQY